MLTSAEWDHPDVFADRAAVLAAFEAWIRRAGERGHGRRRPPVLVANVGDAGVAELVARLADWPGAIVATALVDAAPQRLGSFARGIADRFTSAAGPADVAPRPDHRHRPRRRRRSRSPASTRSPARPRCACRRPAATTRRTPWASPAPPPRSASTPGRSRPGLAGFGGVGRRLERKGEAGGVVVYDDYGHHPTAIRETLAAVRQREPGRRVWAVYEPLTFHRTAALLDAFADALAGGGRRRDRRHLGGPRPRHDRQLGRRPGRGRRGRAPGIPVAAPGRVEATAAWLAGEVRPGDAVLVMGGGRSYRIGELLLEHLEDAMTDQLPAGATTCSRRT